MWKQQHSGHSRLGHGAGRQWPSAAETSHAETAIDTVQCVRAPLDQPHLSSAVLHPVRASARARNGSVECDVKLTDVHTADFRGLHTMDLAGILEVTLLSGTGLRAADPNGLSDPYVRLMVDKKQLWRSSVRNETLKPEWNETYDVSLEKLNGLFPHNTRPLVYESLVLEVWDRDLLSSDDHLGTCRLPLRAVESEREYRLAPAAGFEEEPAGSVTLRMRLKVSSEQGGEDQEGRRAELVERFKKPRAISLCDLYPPNNPFYEHLYCTNRFGSKGALRPPPIFEEVLERHTSVYLMPQRLAGESGAAAAAAAASRAGSGAGGDDGMDSDEDESAAAAALLAGEGENTITLGDRSTHTTPITGSGGRDGKGGRKTSRLGRGTTAAANEMLLGSSTKGHLIVTPLRLIFLPSVPAALDSAPVEVKSEYVASACVSLPIGSLVTVQRKKMLTELCGFEIATQAGFDFSFLIYRNMADIHETSHDFNRGLATGAVLPKKYVTRIVQLLEWLHIESRFPQILAGSWSAHEAAHIEGQSALLTQARAQPFSMRNEMVRMGIPDDVWRFTDVNHSYELTPTYPSILVVPARVDDAQLTRAAHQRSKQRLPALVWLHPMTKVPLCRSAQPMSGMVGTTEDDNTLLRALRHACPNHNPLYIADARPKLNANANAFMGKGFERVADVGDASIFFLNIDNIHVMRESISELARACQLGGRHVGANVDASRWQIHVSNVLRGAQWMAASILHGHPVMVHCSDGWDRTSQLSALTQLLLDPYYRTFQGFRALVAKDFGAFGHMFEKRSSRTRERSPVFLQFLDCVHQIWRQFPAAFEFNLELLVFLADAQESGWFLNFLGNHEHERAELCENMYPADLVGFSDVFCFAEHTEALVKAFNMAPLPFTNPLYNYGVPSWELQEAVHVDPLHISTEVRSMQLWEGFFMRPGHISVNPLGTARVQPSAEEQLRHMVHSFGYHLSILARNEHRIMPHSLNQLRHFNLHSNAVATATKPYVRTVPERGARAARLGLNPGQRASIRVVNAHGAQQAQEQAEDRAAKRIQRFFRTEHRLAQFPADQRAVMRAVIMSQLRREDAARELESQVLSLEMASIVQGVVETAFYTAMQLEGQRNAELYRNRVDSVLLPVSTPPMREAASDPSAQEAPLQRSMSRRKQSPADSVLSGRN